MANSKGYSPGFRRSRQRLDAHTIRRGKMPPIRPFVRLCIKVSSFFVKSDVFSKFVVSPFIMSYTMKPKTNAHYFCAELPVEGALNYLNQGISTYVAFI